jgi:hypothetical protein
MTTSGRGHPPCSPLHAVRVKPDLNDLPDYVVHVSGFSGQDASVLELHMMTQAYAVFGCG